MKPTLHECGIVIVTHNSQETLDWCLEPLIKSSCNVVIVDSGSSNTGYLKKYLDISNIKVIYERNIGFCCANNIGISQLKECEFIHLLNPDARVEVEEIISALDFLRRDENKDVGAATVPLVKYDWENRRSTGAYDSRGIAMRWYGKWVDVSAGEKVKHANLAGAIEIEAACGAFLILRRSALQEASLGGDIGFDSSFVIYKEDIELCLRLRERGWRILLLDKQKAFHCRGWRSKRREMPKWARSFSAYNDLRIALRYRARALPYAIAKWIWVMVFEGLVYRLPDKEPGPSGCKNREQVSTLG